MIFLTFFFYKIFYRELFTIKSIYKTIYYIIFLVSIYIIEICRVCTYYEGMLLNTNVNMYQ